METGLKTFRLAELALTHYRSWQDEWRSRFFDPGKFLWSLRNISALAIILFLLCLFIFTPSPYRGRGIVFELFLCLFVSFFVCLFVYLSARLRENGWTDLHEIFSEMLSPAIAQRTGVNNSVPFARCQQGAGFVVPRTTACFILFSPVSRPISSKLCHVA